MWVPRASLRWFAVGVVLVAIGCGEDDAQPEPRSVDPKSPAIHAAVQSNEAVALKLHSVLRQQPGNLFYSPISIEAVLGMLYAGADGETATQIGAVLDVGDDPRALHEGLGALLGDLAGDYSGRGYTLSVANRLWARPGLDSSPDFLDTTRELYAAPMQAADFGDSERVRAEINRWVDDQTHGKIPELLMKGQITRDTVMTVVNAIYFKAEWAKAFDPDLTRSDTFVRADKTKVTVDMMSTNKVALRAASTENARWIELPYRGGDVSFLACLPTSFNWGAPPEDAPSLDAIEAALTRDALSDVVSQLGESREQIVQMPRFSLRSRLDLIPTFRALGVVDLFDDSRANLSKISASQQLYVNPFAHEATVQVDEEGTVAAAATAAGVQRTSAALPIRFDHPFLFFIRDNLTGAILFTGRVEDPSAKN
ncbi:MAG TPA: serpin family protein [Polyangiales bacterium]|nr:serpin family protein [Polyangiales bacterium]